MKVNAIFVAVLAASANAASVAAPNKRDVLGVNIERRDPPSGSTSGSTSSSIRYCDIPVREEIKYVLELVAYMVKTAKDNYDKHPQKTEKYFKKYQQSPAADRNAILIMWNKVFKESYYPMGRVAIFCGRPQSKCISGANMYTEHNKIVLCPPWWNDKVLSRESTTCNEPSRVTTLLQGYIDEALLDISVREAPGKDFRKALNSTDFASLAQAILWEDLRGPGSCDLPGLFKNPSRNSNRQG